MPEDIFIYRQGTRSSEPIVFLPGWGFAGSIIELAGIKGVPWVYPADLVNPDTLIDDLSIFFEEQGWDRIILVGWSMGANLALDFANSFPHTVKTLVLLAIRQSWPKTEIEAIRNDLLKDQKTFLASFYRKCFLGYKEPFRRFSNGAFSHHFEQNNVDLLLRGLDYLRDSNPSITCGVPVLQFHGMKDIISPVGQIAELPGAHRSVLDHAGHAVFLNQEFLNFIGNYAQNRKKETIKKSFSKAAQTYDSYAITQKELAEDLVQRLPLDKEIKSILEIGCGTGNYTVLLSQKFPDACLEALDFSQEMIEKARVKVTNNTTVNFVCEDAESFLAKANQCFDVITTNSTMQWFENIETAMGRISNLLRPEGFFLGTVFGPQTLAELGRALSAVMKRKIDLAASSFPSRIDFEQSLAKHFASWEVEEKFIKRRYDSLHDLILHIKRTGATGWRDQSPLLLTRSRLHGLDQWFAENCGGYGLSYQVFFLKACKDKG